MKQAEISIIIPVYNCEKYVARCLDSILAQTFKDIEIICVNDGSTDGSLQVLTSYAEKYDCIQVIDCENGGVSRARNIGIEAACGAYIGFVDADDFIEPQMMEFLYKAATTHPDCISICNYEEKTALSNEMCVYSCNPISIAELFPIVGDSALLGLSACNKLFPKSVLDGIRFPVGIATHEDVFFSALACAKAKSLLFVDYAGYDYFPNMDSATRVQFNRKHLTALDALSSCAKALTDIPTKNAEHTKSFCLAKQYKTIVSLRLTARNMEVSTKALLKEAKKKCRRFFYKDLKLLLTDRGIPAKLKLALLMFWYLPFTYKAFRKKTDNSI